MMTSIKNDDYDNGYAAVTSKVGTAVVVNPYDMDA
jgi:hypothetical protein